MTMEGTTASCFSVSQTFTECQITPIHSDAKVEEPLSSCYCLLLVTCSTSSLSKSDTITHRYHTQGEKGVFTH